ncbi:hypothetical protein COTS27_01360 [Spirochaetota bacterium]|nr:hypothetical protein COTS27_01360 [Spirochaetota bacterium]
MIPNKLLILLMIIASSSLSFNAPLNAQKNKSPKSISPIDHLELIDLVNNVGTYADNHNWKGLHKIFANEVVLDYSSFTKQPAETLTGKAITDRWKAFLPGFDITQHKLFNHKIKQKKDRIHVQTDVRALHFIENMPVGGNTWIVDGSYDFIVENTSKGYRISEMKFNFAKTIGNNALPAVAGARTQFDKLLATIETEAAKINNPKNWDKPQNPVPASMEADPNVKIVQNFFTAYGNNDLQGIRNVMATDVEWFIPGRHKLSGTKKGIEQVVDFFKLLQKANFRAEPIIFAANDDYVIDVHRGWSTSDETDVDMNWVLLYKIENGKIKKVLNFTSDAYTSDVFFDKMYSLEDGTQLRQK